MTKLEEVQKEFDKHLESLWKQYYEILNEEFKLAMTLSGNCFRVLDKSYKDPTILYQEKIMLDKDTVLSTVTIKLFDDNKIRIIRSRDGLKDYLEKDLERLAKELENE